MEFNQIYSTVDTNQVHIIYDSYIEESLKKCERIHRNADVDPLEYVNLLLSSPILVQLDKFRACIKNKENLQILRREFFIENSCEVEEIVLSGYVTDADSNQNCLQIQNEGEQVAIDDILSSIVEADARIIPHVAFVIKEGWKQVVVLPNDTDIVVLLLHFYDQFLKMTVKELWVKYSTGDKSRYISIGTLGQKLGEAVCSTILNIHVLTGCDSTSKIETKAAALKANYHLLTNIG